MRYVVIVITAVSLLFLLGQVAGQDVRPDPTEDRFGFWMNVKLVESQKLFAALARADYAAIQASGERLRTVSSLEGFVRRRSPEYTTQLKSFEFAVDEVVSQAKRESIEGATLGFQQLTLSCVNCHRQLRE